MQPTGESCETCPSPASRWVLPGMVLLGLLLRVPRLLESLWYDEIAAWADYGVEGPRHIVTTYFDPANHVAHTLLTWCSFALFDRLADPEIVLRLPALAFSLLSIVAIHDLARRAGGPRLATLAAAVAAVAPVSVLEGADARGYSMMIFFAAAATGQALRALETKRLGPWILYAALCALGVWSHLMTVFVPVGHAVWLLGRAIGERSLANVWRGAVGVALAAVFALALYAPILDDIVRVRQTFAGEGSAGPSFFGPEGLHGLLQLGGAWYWWAAGPGFAMVLVGCVTAARAPRLRQAALLAVLGLPAMLLAVGATGAWTYARFGLFAFPGVALLIAGGLEWLIVRRPAAGRAAILGLALAFGLDPIVRPPKQPLRDAASYVAERLQPGEGVLIVGLRHEVMGVYAGALEPRYSLFHGANLEAELAGYEPTWVIVMYPRSVAPARYELLKGRGYEEVERLEGWIDWTNGDVFVWERR